MSKTYIPKDLRQRVARTARYRCGYCLTQEEVVGVEMDIEHIIPEALNGPTEEENLWLACGRCNECKGNRATARDPMTGDTVPLFNPRKQRWDHHFAWTEEDTVIAGMTQTGRAPVEALNLNRASLVRARRRWVAAGWHPPKD
jgi:5-methylcytosine-specific restriction endonuclease McrA